MTYRMEKIVPLIGPSVAGPLGAMHLPRMWEKSVLSAAGLLWEGYFDNDKGFNAQVCDALGLEPEAWFAFLTTMPTYPQAEDYVGANAKSLSAESIAALNERITTYERPEEASAIVRTRTGIADPNLRISFRLLDYDDWFTIREEIAAHRAGGIEPLVPMVSSSQMGLLGIPHLPRLWIKALLAAVQALPADWKTGTVCGFDTKVADMIGLDLVAATAYITKELPDYGSFEKWVRDHIAQPDAAKKAEWAATIAGMQKNEEQAARECVECGLSASGLRGTVLLNDLVDWKYMHDHAVAGRVARA
jgi:hypothetical protein